MVTINDTGVVLLCWLSFLAASTWSWGSAYLVDQDVGGLLPMLGRQFVGLCVGVGMCWWLIGTFSPPFFTHEYVSIAILTHIASCMALGYVFWRLDIRPQSGRLALLITPVGEEVVGPTFETEWIALVSTQTASAFLWSALLWRPLA